jgi:glycosyltransferase involved in cell wall biosynthesis
VRIFNLMRQAAGGWNQVLVAFADELATPPPELLALCREIIVVRRHHSHYRLETPLPETVHEFSSNTFRSALRQTMQRWNPGIAQLEFTQMAQYADAAAPAGTVLVEHDITFDLAAQLAQNDPGLERQQQLEKWRTFETNAWSKVDVVITMSEKDRQTAESAARLAVTLPNGVDTDRFQPAKEDPEPKRLLFIGSFAHLPNLMALDFFLREVWTKLDGRYTLHVIAGSRHEFYLDFFRRDAAPNLNQPGIEVEGFISDVRPAYRRAALVVAPLVASAGTNIKVLEAMAMGRVVISTPAGINGLDLTREHGVAVGATAFELAALIEVFGSQPELRREVEAAARRTALSYDWRAIAQRQTALYKNLINAER